MRARSECDWVLARQRWTRAPRTIGEGEQAARKLKTMEIAGASFDIETIDYAGLLREHIDGLDAPIGPRAKDDEFTPLVTLGGRRLRRRQWNEAQEFAPTTVARGGYGGRRRW